MHRDGPSFARPSHFRWWWIYALSVGVASALHAQEASPSPPPKQPFLGPQPFVPNISNTEGPTQSTDDPNPLSPWVGVDTSLKAPDNFDPVAAAESVFEQPADLTDTQDLAPPDLPFNDSQLDTTAGSLLRNPDGILFNTESLLFTGNGGSPVSLTPESALPYGDYQWPILYTPRSIPIFRRVRDLAHVGPFRVGIDLSVTDALTNNVFGTPSGMKADQIRTFAPTVYLEAGTKALVRVLYQPSWVSYAKYNELSTANQAFFLRWTYPFSKLKLGGGINYVTQSGLYTSANASGTNNNVKQTTISGQLFGTYPLGSKTTIGAGAEAVWQKSDPGDQSLDATVNGALYYRWSTQTTVGGGIRLGSSQSPADDQTFQEGRLNLSWHPTTALQFGAEGGVELRQLDLGANHPSQLLTPVFNVQANYNPSSSVLFNITLFRNVLNTTFQNVNLDINTGVTTSLLLRLWGRVNLQGQMGYGYTEQLTANAPDSHFSFFQGGLMASYQIAKFCEVQIFDNLQQRFGDSLGNDYWSNTIGVSLTLKY